MRWEVLAPPPDARLEPGPAPSFAVIIPAYQAAGFIADAVRSALEQTTSPAEVIVCDDGSTDDLDGALAPFRDRIHLVRQPNRGLPAAKNAAARTATSDFVAVLDADDIYLPERIEALGQLASMRPDLDIVTTDVYLEADGHVLGRFTARNAFVTDDQRRGILQRNFIWSGAAIRREALLAVGGFDETVDCSDDWDCWRRMIFHGSRIGMVDAPLAHYRIRADSMTASRARDFLGRLDVLQRARQDPALTPEERSIVEATIRATEPRARYAVAEEALREGRPGRRRAALAVAFDPSSSMTLRFKAVLASGAPGIAGSRLARARSDPRLRARSR